MRAVQPILYTLAGAAGALALVLSCGDDDGPGRPDGGSPIDAAQAADAAGCDCPAPPQPIDERLRWMSREFSFLSADTSLTVFLDCVEQFGPGARLVSGGCGAPASPRGANFVLTESSQASYKQQICTWHKDRDTGGILKVEVNVVCLVPEGTPAPDAGL